MRWENVVWLNRVLEFAGSTATVLWIAFLTSLALGVDWEATVEHAINSGRPVEAAVALAIVLPTVLFLLMRSLVNAARWRLHRELWRRDVERLTASR